MKQIYPAVFEKEKDGQYSVFFPDFKGANTCGNNLEDAFNMAADCLGGVLFACQEDKKNFPVASDMSKFKNELNSFVSLVNVDLEKYIRDLEDKPVKKNLYIPKGLNDKAENAGINFSAVLRKALENELK